MHFLRHVAIFVAAAVGGSLGLFPLLTLGLVVAEVVIIPLALGVGAVLAALAASWAGILLPADGTRPRLARVVGATLAMAALLALLWLAYLVAVGQLRPRVFAVPTIVPATWSALVLALTASLAAARLRQVPGGGEGRLTVALLALVLVLVPGVLVLAALAGLTGA